MHQSGDPVRTVERGGVVVEKTVRSDDGAAVATLDVTSTRSDPTTVRLSDPDLDAAGGELLEIDGATVDDETAVFERSLEPESAWEITYRLADVDAEELDAEPRVLAPDGDDLDELLDRARSDALRGFVGGERESLSGGEPSDRSEAVERPADPEPTSRPATADRSPSDGVARALLAELRDDDLDSDTRAALRAELRPERSREIRIEHLQQRVSDLAAYTDTLERFIDEHGPIEEAFDGVESELEAIRDEQAALERRIDELEAEFDRVDDRVDELEAFRDGVSSVFRELDGGDGE